MVLVSQSNAILKAVILVYGMNKEEPSDRVRLAAITALSSALKFAATNFQNEVHFFVFAKLMIVC